MICAFLLAGVLSNINPALIFQNDPCERKAIDSWAQCRGENCQLWDKARGDCGLKQFESVDAKMKKAINELCAEADIFIATSITKKKEGSPA